LGIVRAIDVWSIDQFYQSLYRPDLVREKLAGDPRGLVRDAAAKLDLAKVLETGDAPVVTLTSPREGERFGSSQVTADIAIEERGGGIGRVEWRVNGVTVGVDAAPAPPGGGAGRLTRGLSLDAGDKVLRVVAYTGSTLIASVPAQVTVAGPPGPAAQAAAPAGGARLYVLAAGVNGYADQRFKLAFSVPDAKAMGQGFADAHKGL